MKDIVCGMEVSDDSAYHHEHGGKVFYFCSDRCLGEFAKNPEQYLNKEALAPEHTGDGSIIYGLLPKRALQSGTMGPSPLQKAKARKTVSRRLSHVAEKIDVDAGPHYPSQSRERGGSHPLRRFPSMPDQRLDVLNGRHKVLLDSHFP
jgi:YHS domain-containing protein